MGLNPVTLGAVNGKLKGIASPLVSVTPNADKTKADYEYTDGTVIRDVPLVPESSDAQIEKIVDEKLDSVKSELDGKLVTKVAKADLDGTSIYYGDDNKVHAVGGSADTSELERKVDKLYKLTQGQIWDFEQRTESGTNDVPSGAKYMSVLSADGKTEQTTYNGYQLIPQFTNGNVIEKVIASDGNTARVVADNDKISISLSHAIESATNNITLLSFRPELPLVGAYTISSGVDSTFYGQLNIKKSDGTYKYIVKNGTYTFDGTELECVVNLQTTSNVPIPQNSEAKIMFEAGSTAHDFEPYVGGIASPNPNYPQDVVGVEEINVSLAGRQLWNEQTEIKDGYLYSKNYIKVYSGKIYTIAPYGTYSSDGYQIIFYDSNKRVVTDDYYIRGGSNGNIAVPVNAEFMKFRCFTSYGTIYKSNIMVEYGSVAHAYEPYIEPITRTIVPPKTMYKIGDYADKLDVAEGVWKFNTKATHITKTATSKESSESGFNVTTLGDARNDFSNQGYNYKAIMSKHYRSATLGEIRTSKPSYSICVYNKQVIARGDGSETSLSVDTDVCYLIEETTEPINASDLAWLRSLDGTSTDKHITITDQDGNDVSWIAEYIVKLNEVASQEGTNE